MLEQDGLASKGACRIFLFEESCLCEINEVGPETIAAKTKKEGIQKIRHASLFHAIKGL